MNRINFAPRQLGLLLISLIAVTALSGCGGGSSSGGSGGGSSGGSGGGSSGGSGGGSGGDSGGDSSTPMTDPMTDPMTMMPPVTDPMTMMPPVTDPMTPPVTPPPAPTPPAVACASYTPVGTDGRGTTELTAMVERTNAAPNCVYEASFVDNGTPLTASITLANLDADGVHVFQGSLVVGEDSPTLAGVPTTPVVLTIEAGATIAFASAADRVIVNRGARIEAVGTATNPITFTSLADVVALGTADTTDDLAATATDQWMGITINGAALNNDCTYSDPASNAARRPFEAADPFTLAANQPTLTAEPTTDDPPVETCSLGAAVFTTSPPIATPLPPIATPLPPSQPESAVTAIGANPALAVLGYGFHGGTRPDDNSGTLDYVIIKHVGDAAVFSSGEPDNRSALHLRSVGSGTTLRNIEVYSVDGSGIQIEGGGADLTNVLVYNSQFGVAVTEGYLGALDTVLVSQADGLGVGCVVLASGASGTVDAAQIADGMNTRVTARNLTCDVSADDIFGSGVTVLEGTRVRIQNAIIVGSRVAADDTNSSDNYCLDFFMGDRAIIEADGVIASCLEAPTFATVANFSSTSGVGAQVIATDADATSPTEEQVAMDIQLHTNGSTPASPLAGTDTALAVLYNAGTVDDRALFSLLLASSRVDNATPTVVASAAAPNDSSRAYLGAIATGTGNNPFFGWTFGVFTATPPPPPPPLPPPLALAIPAGCASYTPVGTDGRGTTELTALAVPVTESNCVYGASFVDNGTPLTASITLANLDADGVHVFQGSLVVGEDSPTLAGVPGTPVVLTIEAGATIAFASAADRVIVNRGAQIMAVGTADNPITFTSLADVEALGTADTTDDLAATATDEWRGITINGGALNNDCTYSEPVSGARRPFEAADPFTLAATQPTLTAEPTTDDPPVETCSLGAAVFTAVTTGTGDPDVLASGFHGGTSPDDNSGTLDYVIIKHVGDAAVEVVPGVGPDGGDVTFTVDRDALYLRSVGSGTTLSNIEVYSVDGSGIAIDGGGADLTNVLVYNPQIDGILATGGYLGTLDTVLVSQAEGAGRVCVLVISGIGGQSADQITDGMNTRVTARNLTCDVSADRVLGSGVTVLEGTRTRIQNAIIVGSRVAADDTFSSDNYCLDFFMGDRSIIEVDGVIASCLEALTFVTVANFSSTSGVGARVIATDADATSPTAEQVAMDIQFHTNGSTPISPLAGTDTALAVLYDAGTVDDRALFSLLLASSRVDNATPTVVASAVAPNNSTRTYLGAIAAGEGNNPFFGWTFGVFTATPPPPPPPLPPPLALAIPAGCASYTPVGTDGRGTTELTALAVLTTEPNCVYGASFVDNGTPLTASITLANLDADGVHVFQGSLIVGEDSPTLAGVPTTPVVLTIEAGATIAFASAADRVIVNRGARIEAVGTADNPITFTSLKDVIALGTADTTDDLAATATDEWRGITINGGALNNDCTYSEPVSGARRPFEAADPFTLAATQPTLTLTDCSQNIITADGFHGGTSLADDSGELAYVIIKHVGDSGASSAGGDALRLHSVGSGTTLSNIEVYSVKGSGIVIEGGGADLTNVLVYNPQQAQGVFATGGYLGTLDTVLVSQAEGASESCIDVDSGFARTAEDIIDGMNTRVTIRNLTCDIGAGGDFSSGVIVGEGARVRIQNAIIVGSRVAVDDATSFSNYCLELRGDQSFIEVDGVIASCLQASTVVTDANFLATSGVGAQVIATDADATSPTANEVAMDIQFQDISGNPDTISPLAGTNTELVVLTNAGTVDDRALFSLLLASSTVNNATPTVVPSAVAPNDSTRTYLGAIAEGAGNNPFSGWTFGVFSTP